jgi:hypothetical protein
LKKRFKLRVGTMKNTYWMKGGPIRLGRMSDSCSNFAVPIDRACLLCLSDWSRSLCVALWEVLYDCGHDLVGPNSLPSLKSAPIGIHKSWQTCVKIWGKYNLNIEYWIVRDIIAFVAHEIGPHRSILRYLENGFLVFSNLWGSGLGSGPPNMEILFPNVTFTCTRVYIIRIL